MPPSSIPTRKFCRLARPARAASLRPRSSPRCAGHLGAPGLLLGAVRRPPRSGRRGPASRGDSHWRRHPPPPRGTRRRRSQCFGVLSPVGRRVDTRRRPGRGCCTALWKEYIGYFAKRGRTFEPKAFARERRVWHCRALISTYVLRTGPLDRDHKCLEFLYFLHIFKTLAPVGQEFPRILNPSWHYRALDQPAQGAPSGSATV
jgi:hypothetical protein